MLVEASTRRSAPSGRPTRPAQKHEDLGPGHFGVGALDILKLGCFAGAAVFQRIARLQAEDQEQDRQKDRALHPGDRAHEGQGDEQHRGHHHDHIVLVQVRPLGVDTCDQRGNPQDQQHVCRVRSDHVAQRDARSVFGNGPYRDQKFRGRGAEGNNAEADQKRRHAQPKRHVHRAAHQGIPGQQKNYQPQGRDQKVHNLSLVATGAGSAPHPRRAAFGAGL